MCPFKKKIEEYYTANSLESKYSIVLDRIKEKIIDVFLGERLDLVTMWKIKMFIDSSEQEGLLRNFQNLAAETESKIIRKPVEIIFRDSKIEEDNGFFVFLNFQRIVNGLECGNLIVTFFLDQVKELPER